MNKKKNKILLIILMIIIITIIILITINFNTLRYKPFETEYNVVENIVTNKNHDYKLVLNEHSFSPSNIVQFKNNERLYYANITTEEIIINGEKIIIKVENIASNASCVNENKPLNVGINDKILLSFEYEGCYIINIEEVFIINNKYIGIMYRGEALGATVEIYNTDGEKLYTRFVMEFDTSNYTFKAYDENDEEFIINDYKLVHKGDEIIDSLVQIGKKSYCDMMCEGDKCC